MKIITNGEPIFATGASICEGDVRIYLASVPTAIGDTVQLTNDDGTELRTDTVSDYLRHYLDGTTLVLTNIPEPVEPEEDTDTEPDVLTQTQLALAVLAETEAAHDLENKLALAELAETITGGTANG